MVSHRGRQRARVAIATVIAFAVVGFAAVKLLDRPAALYYARPVDNHTLAIGTVTGPGTWTRVTAVQETSDRIVITVSSLSAPLPGAGDDLNELLVQLAEPIGARIVTDASTGLVVPRTSCLPPAYLAPGCT
jgi:hypothetical protein